MIINFWNWRVQQNSLWEMREDRYNNIDCVWVVAESGDCSTAIHGTVTFTFRDVCNVQEKSLKSV